MTAPLARVALALLLALAPASVLASGAGASTGIASGGAAQIVGGTLCSVQPQESRPLCEGLAARDCGLVGAAPDSYWLCRAFTDANCSLTANPDMFGLCRGVVTEGCSVAPSAYWVLCEGVVQRTCANLDPVGWSWCAAILSALPPPEARIG